MKKSVSIFYSLLVLIFSISIISCAVISQNPARWDSSKKSTENKTVFWKDGVQFVSIEKNNIIVTVSGNVSIAQNVYILVTIYNDNEQPIELYPAYSRLIQNDDRFIPLTPKEIRLSSAQNSSFLSTMYFLSGMANAYAYSNSKSINEKMYYQEQMHQAGVNNYIAQSQIQSQESQLIDMVLKNNLILSGETYTGYLIYKHFNMDKGGFDFVLEVDKTIFNFRGKFFDGYDYDEYDIPEQINILTFD